MLDCFRQSWMAASRLGTMARLRLGLVFLLDTIRSAPPEWWSPRTPFPTERRGATLVDTFLQDFRYALRSFRSAPAVTLVAALTIAIGIGATTTIFSVANALLLRAPTGVRDAGSLVTVHSVSRDGSSFHAFSYLDYRDLQRAESGLEELAGFTVFPASLKTGEDPELRMGMLVSGNYFRALGTRPALGRFFLPEEDAGLGGPRVMVLSHAVWQRRFAGDSGIVGRTVELNGQPFTVIGIAEPAFRGHMAAIDMSLWVPLVLDPVVSNRQILESRRSSWLEMVGRLAPGATRERVARVLTSVRPGEAPGPEGAGRPAVVDVRRYSAVPGQMLTPVVGFLGLLLVLAALVLLIASANVANVLLARASARGKEIAIRLAIGAGRGRLIRQLVTESVLLFLVGGVGGTLLAVWATRGLGALRPPVSLPIELDFHVDLRVLAVALAVTLVTGLIFGLAPALQSTKPNLTRALKDEPGTARVGRFRIRGAFVAAQVAGTTLLLVTAGLFTRALGRAGTIDLGFDPAPVQVLNLELQVHSYTSEQVRDFAERLLERAAAIPGVAAAAATDFLPLNMGNQETVVAVDGREQRPDVGMFQTDFATVTPEFFGALALPLARGRPFRATDREGSAPVAIINEALARRIWPGEDPVGKQLRVGGVDGTLSEIVGVARNAKYRSIGDESVPMVYVAFAQQGGRTFSLLVRSRPGAVSPAGALRDLVRELDPSLPIASNTPYLAIIGLSLLPNRIALGLALLFGGTGLILAAVGLYGVLSYTVSRRRREIGIRIALGAASRDVRNMVLGDGLRLVAIGLLLGFGVAGVLSRLLRSFLFGVSPLDPVTYAAITVLLGSVALAACLMPVRKALSTEPLEVLRHD
jgi:predicted permease